MLNCYCYLEAPLEKIPSYCDNSFTRQEKKKKNLQQTGRKIESGSFLLYSTRRIFISVCFVDIDSTSFLVCVFRTDFLLQNR